MTTPHRMLASTAAVLMLTASAWGIAPAARAAPQPSSRQAESKVPAVRMYATRNCPYCLKARAYLTQRGIAWEEIDIESSEQANREFKAHGGMGTPLFVVGETRVQGFDPVRLEAALREIGAATTP